MKLSALAKVAGLPAPEQDVEITGLTADSRAVEAGMLFAALPGTRVHGKSFIGQALAFLLGRFSCFQERLELSLGRFFLRHYLIQLLRRFIPLLSQIVHLIHGSHQRFNHCLINGLYKVLPTPL